MPAIRELARLNLKEQLAGGRVFSLFVSTAVSQHSEGDSTAPNGLIGQPEPAISL
jgi:hypothetical protein